MESGDDVPAPASDISAYRRVRQDRAAESLIHLFSQVLSKPLHRRELTPEEQARREQRLRERARLRRLG